MFFLSESVQVRVYRHIQRLKYVECSDLIIDRVKHIMGQPGCYYIADFREYPRFPSPSEATNQNRVEAYLVLPRLDTFFRSV